MVMAGKRNRCHPCVEIAMSKIKSLEVDTLHVAGNAVNEFVFPAYPYTSITVSNPLSRPIMIWFTGDTAVTLQRSRDNKLLFNKGGYIRLCVIDDDPQTSETYTILGTGSVITGALVVHK